MQDTISSGVARNFQWGGGLRDEWAPKASARENRGAEGFGTRESRRRGGLGVGRGYPYPPPHWGWGLGRGLCPLPRKFLDFLYQNGDLCILGGIIYRVSKALLHAKWYFWSAKTKSYCRLRARKDRERQRKKTQNRNKSPSKVRWFVVWRGRDAAEGVEGVGYLGMIFHFFCCWIYWFECWCSFELSIVIS